MRSRSYARCGVWSALVVILMCGCGKSEQAKPVEADHTAEAEELLQIARTAMTVENWDDSTKSLDAAEKLPAPPDLQGRLAEARRELTTAVKLRELRREWPNDSLTAERDPVATAYRQAFREYGLEPEAATEEMKERGRTSPIRLHLVAALDEWARILFGVPEAKRRGLLEFADAIDDSAPRRAVRQTVRANDGAEMLRLSRQADLATFTPLTLLLLARTMVGAGDVLAAEDMLRRFPDDGLMKLALGAILSCQCRFAAAEAAYRDAVRLQPAESAARFYLGGALLAQDKSAEAETVFRDLLRINHKHWGAWSNLGVALLQQKKVSEAEAVFREAMQSLPACAQFPCDLGYVLAKQKRFAEAETLFRDALRLDAGHVQATRNLAKLMERTDRWEEAEEVLRAATRANPENEPAWEYLAQFLIVKEEYEEAVAVLEKALLLFPKASNTRYTLASVLEHQGKFENSLAELRKVNILELVDSMGELQLRNRLEKAVLLEPRLPSLLHRELKPSDNDETLILAWMCCIRRDTATSVRWYEEAFRAKPMTVREAPYYRANAAYAAVRAACGIDKDAPPEQEVRERLRRLALASMTDLVAELGKMADQDKNCHGTVEFLLQGFQRVKAYQGLRDPVALGRLPQDEREAWVKFWNDVQALRQRLNVEWN